ncbi:MAG: diaminohydroxyphosphoribosylaminopyrimidine deaminase [Lentisphaeria bacterium]|jgi:diaminohydroxyphosphoribosylaminopyrimidine deaminase/5-amino-6-(5-phosphoribosylamino)uracil reductase
MSNIPVQDQMMMMRALQLARLGLNGTSPNPRVGCVLLSEDGRIVGEGYHCKAGSAHAEIAALVAAGAQARAATAYVTLEPCCHHGKTGPCTEALIAAGVKRVVYAMEDPNPQVAGRGLEALQAAGIEIVGPVEEQAAWALNPGFIKRMRTGLPFIRCKMAMSLDGRTAMASGESKWITGPSARQDVQTLRARSCAIVTGVESVIHDDPSLTVRLGDNDRQPLRVIVDTHGRCPMQADILDQPGQTVIACSNMHAPSEADSRKYWRLPERNGRIDLYALTRRLGQEGCNEVLIETGATLAGAFVSAGLVDELIVYMAGKLMGRNARPLFDLPIDKMRGALTLSIQEVRAVGADWRITAVPDPET